MQKAINALQTIREGEMGDMLISAIEQNKYYVRISKSRTNYQKGINVYWNPTNTNGGIEVNGNTNRPAFVGLAHELAHSFELITTGKNDTEVWGTVGGKNFYKAEIFATHWENIVRSEHDIALRKFYGYEMNEETNRRIGVGTILQDDNKTNIYQPWCNYEIYKRK